MTTFATSRFATLSIKRGFQLHELKPLLLRNYGSLRMQSSITASLSCFHRSLASPSSNSSRSFNLFSSRSLVTSSISTEKDANVEFFSDNLFPPPTDQNLNQYGMPLLARAAHHARLGRTLAYDLYNPHPYSHQHQQSFDARGNKKKIEYSYHDILSLSTHIHNFFTDQKTTISGASEDDGQIQREASQTHYNQNPPPRIAFLCHPGPLYIATQFAAWSSGSIAIPLCTSHRHSELAYVLKDCDPQFIVDGTSALSEGRELRKATREAGLMSRYWCLGDVLEDYYRDEKKRNSQQESEGDIAGGTHHHVNYALGANGEISSMDSPAMIIYTSGTTGNPKGVVHTHRNIYHQITDLTTSWGWTHNDAILHFLPLHHVHGVINKLGCAVWSGASVEFVRFNPVKIWERLAEAAQSWKSKRNGQVATGNTRDGDQSVPEKRALTLFMAVPTIYAKMMEVLPQLPKSIQPSEIMRQSPIRLMVSGSAALPTGIFNRWKELTGHTILERYGMTEFAMALSNPLEPEDKRLPGYVGLPLPSVEVKIIDEDTGEIIHHNDGAHKSTAATQSGELCVRGPTVFLEYWQKPHHSAQAFDFDGFFKTGDVAEYDHAQNSYHILGRVSADIIKCGGHKLSSLQIERVLLEHPDLLEAVVLGVPDETYGERVGLICRLKPGAVELDLNSLQAWCKERMAAYKIPTRLIVMEKDIPKNVMGKVSKKLLVKYFDNTK